MPTVAITTLPAESRVWVFGSAKPLDYDTESLLLASVDRYLDTWKAHGVPLTVSREWREGRFLAVAVDTTQAHASGCSIDGLFRELQRLEKELGAGFVGNGLVFYRDAQGTIHSVSREDWIALGEQRQVTRDTPVFDLTVMTFGDWQTRFETRAGESWHGQLLPA